MAKKKKDTFNSFGGFIYNMDATEEKNVETIHEEKTTEREDSVKGKGRPKEKREIKKRISLVVLPSLYENAQKIAYVNRDSISELVSQLLQDYVEQNKDKIEEYDKLKENSK